MLTSCILSLLLKQQHAIILQSVRYMKIIIDFENLVKTDVPCIIHSPVFLDVLLTTGRYKILRQYIGKLFSSVR